MDIAKISNSGKKVCLPLPSFGWEIFYLKRQKNDERFYTHTDKLFRHIVRHSIKYRKKADFNQFDLNENPNFTLINIIKTCIVTGIFKKTDGKE